MKRWEVTLIVLGSKIKHVVKADDFDGAIDRASRAHNGKTTVMYGTMAEASRRAAQ